MNEPPRKTARINGRRWRNWASGFAVLTFHNGKLLPPELVEKHDEDNVVFRGTVIPV